MKKIIVVASVFLMACSSRQVTAPVASPSSSIIINGKIFATLFQQRAAEYRALCFQAYNLAKWRLDAYKPGSNKPLAIITDIDETVLDNSAYEAQQTLEGKDFEPASWFEWTSKGIADSIPGAPSFFRYAASKGVSVFYISNREERERKATLENLQRLGFPNADDAHYLPKTTSSGKEPRRQLVASTHEIALVIGDNLTDFTSLYDKKSLSQRLQTTEDLVQEFGSKYIMLPNSIYGDWEWSIFQYNYQFTTAQKDSVIRSMLKKP